MIIIFGISAFIFTLLGGLFALKFRDKLHLILGFSAGAVLAVAFFDLLPEAIELGSDNYSISLVTSMIAVGFIIFMIFDRLLSIHNHHDEDHCQNKNHAGFHGATALSIHSFLDGLGVGLAFQASLTVGVILAVAVLTHDFSDGINTVNYILKNKQQNKAAVRWLLIDAVAPILGIMTTFFFTVSQNILAIILAIFCGFFLYIGASDLLPESHHQHPKIMTTIMTILGMLVLYAAIYFVKI